MLILFEYNTGKTSILHESLCSFQFCLSPMCQFMCRFNQRLVLSVVSKDGLVEYDIRLCSNDSFRRHQCSISVCHLCCQHSLSLFAETATADVVVRLRASPGALSPSELRVAIIGNVDSGKSTMVSCCYGQGTYISLLHSYCCACLAQHLAASAHCSPVLMHDLV